MAVRTSKDAPLHIEDTAVAAKTPCNPTSASGGDGRCLGVDRFYWLGRSMGIGPGFGRRGVDRVRGVLLLDAAQECR